MLPVHECKITAQIASAKETITNLTRRIDVLEDSLGSPELPAEKRAQIETEISEIRKLLERNKEILSTLHKENTKSFAVAACLFFLCFFVFGVYCMIYGR